MKIVTTLRENDRTKDVSKMQKKEIISIDEYFKLPPVLWQRFTEGRAKKDKVKKSLTVLRPEHINVEIAELTQDCEYYGKIYKKGYRAILNGNTRQHFWKNNLSDFKPDFVYATIFLFDNMNDMRKSYDTFDSIAAVEIKKEKLYGYLHRIHNFTPSCTKLEKGEILSALNLACNYFDPIMFNQSQAKNDDQLKAQIDIYIEEIKAFDKICNSPKNWDQALVCAALVCLKVYGTKNEVLLECLDLIDRRAMDTKVKERDGATHICYEWESKRQFTYKSTSLENLTLTSAFAIYWIMQYMKGEKLSQLGYNWKQAPKNLFEEFHKNNVLKNSNSNLTKLLVNS